MIDRNVARIAHSCSPDAKHAVHELHSQVKDVPLGLLIFFCSSTYDLGALASELNQNFLGVPVIGCTTAGEIGPEGYRRNSIVCAAFPDDVALAAIGLIERLQEFSLESGALMVEQLLTQLDSRSKGLGQKHRFALQLIDGLSRREELVVHTFQQSLGRIPLFGGSAGDDMNLVKTSVFLDGAFHQDAAVLAIIETEYPFTVFKTQHFVGGDERLVVTDADIHSRTIREINGLPAAHEYARVIGIRPENLNSGHFSASPVVVRINGVDYVRSIQKANADGSLSFHCAIEKGLILRVARGIDFMGNLHDVFDEIRNKVGEPQLVLICDCIFRHIEMANEGWTQQVESLFQDNKVVGFNTYGEQYMGTHVNQTLTGLALGRERKS